MLDNNNIIIILVAINFIVCFYAAWSIGANDVANAFGTSVGSGAITLRNAIVIAAIFEFSGAFFVGSKVSSTIGNGLINLNAFPEGQEKIIILGMFSCLAATSIWNHFATSKGLPVSTTHAIVGSLVGFGLIAVDNPRINMHWDKIGEVALSWIVSPIAGAIIAVLMYFLVVIPIYRANDSLKKLKIFFPWLVALVAFIIALSMFWKGLKNLGLDRLPVHMILLYSLIFAVIAWIISYVFRSKLGNYHKKDIFLEDEHKFGGEVRKVESIFGILQIATACYMSFAHGANDVGNAIGPLVTVWNIVKHLPITATEEQVPPLILIVGGVGIVIGLATLGYKVIATIGKDITGITPSRGFCAEFGCATSVLLCSKLGLPVSTTHVIVGAVVGIGLVRGIGALKLDIVKNIFSSWLYTLPVSAAFTMLLFTILKVILQW